MDEPHADPAPPDPADREDPDVARAQRLHERTGEIELLISAALFFGLLQIPGGLDAWYDALSPRLEAGQLTVVFTGWYYLKLIVYTLLGAFGLNILARGYWVGLLGLDSVYPHGVRWERVRYGPIAKALYRERARSLPALARRADDFSSLIFSVAYWTAILFVLSVVLSAVLGVAALVLQRTVLPGWSAFRVWLSAVVVVALFPVVPVAVDKALAGRIRPESPVGRGIRGTLGAWFSAFASALYLPIQLTLTSNASRRLWWPTYALVFLALAAAFVAGELTRTGRFALSPTAYLPAAPGPRSVDSRYFEDGEGDPSATWPTIPSDVIEGPWLRLRLPIVARQDAPRIEAACADVAPAGRRGLVRWSVRAERASPVEEAALLTCIGSIWIVRLDGTEIRPEWDFGTSRLGGVGSLVAYLPTEGMAPGPHVLGLEEVRLGGEPPDGEEVRRHFIRFRR